MLHVMPFMGPDLEINLILFYSIDYLHGEATVHYCYEYLISKAKLPCLSSEARTFAYIVLVVCIHVYQCSSLSSLLQAVIFLFTFYFLA